MTVHNAPSFSPQGNSLMLAAFVMVSALLAVGFGYVTFAKTATSGGFVWDLGFVSFAITFLASFVTLIQRQAETEMEEHDDRDPGDSA